MPSFPSPWCLDLDPLSILSIDSTQRAEACARKAAVNEAAFTSRSSSSKQGVGRVNSRLRSSASGLAGAPAWGTGGPCTFQAENVACASQQGAGSQLVSG